MLLYQSSLSIPSVVFISSIIVTMVGHSQIIFSVSLLLLCRQDPWVHSLGIKLIFNIQWRWPRIWNSRPASWKISFIPNFPIPFFKHFFWFRVLGQLVFIGSCFDIRKPMDFVLHNRPNDNNKCSNSWDFFTIVQP